jgi:hypothetical protein
LERAGRLVIDGYSVEGEAYRTVGRHELKPDMYVELTVPNRGQIKFFAEIDLASEGQRQIRAKLQRYYRAYCDATDIDVFPLTLWIAIDEYRAKELRWLIKSEMNEEGQRLFNVCTISTIPDLFS